MIRVVLPTHLRNLAGIEGEVTLSVDGTVSPRGVIDALEAQHPTLRGTIRDQATGARRPFMRYFACERDLSLEPPDAVLPEEVVSGREPFLIVAAMAGG